MGYKPVGVDENSEFPARVETRLTGKINGLATDIVDQSLEDLNSESITDSTEVGRALITADSASSARLTLGITNGGGVDPANVGYDLYIIAGQSNAAGASLPVLPEVYDYPHDRVHQFAMRGTYVNTIRRAVEPLDGAPQDVGSDSAQGIGPGLAFGRQMARRTPVNRSVLLVPCAVGSSALVGGNWPVNGSFYNQVIDGAKKALSAAGPNSKIAGIIWGQGETDAANNVTKANYIATFDAMIAGWRAALPGGDDILLIVNSMVPEWVAEGGGTKSQIQAAHAETPQRISNSIFIQAPTGYGQASGIPNIHYTAAGQRELARRMAISIFGFALETPSISSVVPGDGSVLVSWPDPFAIPPGETYNVQYRILGAPTWTNFGSPVAGLSRNVTGLTNGSTYEFRVRIETPMASEYSVAVQATPSNADAPSAYSTAVNTDAPLVYIRGNSPVVDSKGLATVSKGAAIASAASIGDAASSMDFPRGTVADSRLLLGNPAGLVTSLFTVEMLVRFDALASDQYLIARDNGNATRDWRFSVVLEGGIYKVDFYKLDGTIINARTTTGLTTGTTYHLAAVLDATNVIRIYINGSQAAVSGTVVSGTLKDTQQISVGNSGGSYNGGVDGQIAGVALYNKALSSARILAHAQAAGVA